MGSIIHDTTPDSGVTAVSAASVEHPEVVFGLPVFNESRYIKRTLASIQAQTHQGFAALISDNCSSDDTERLCREFCASDSRFTYVRQRSNIGAVANFDFVRRHTRSPLFAWVGGHDTLHPSYLRFHLDRLAHHPQACVSFSYFRFVDEADRIVRSEGPSGAEAPHLNPFSRYLWTVAVGEEIAAIHGLWRRAALQLVPLHPCKAPDQVMLAASSLQGSFLSSTDPLYLRRDMDLASRSTTYSERVTGRHAALLTVNTTVDAYMSDFDLFIPAGSPHRAWRPVIRWLVNDRFSGRPVRLTKVIRSLGKRTHLMLRVMRPTRSVPSCT